MKEKKINKKVEVRDDDIFVIVPTLNPNLEIFEEFLEKLKKEFKNILVYDDGCRHEYDYFFEKIESEGIIVLHHYVNLGKGRAMKDAFNYLLNTYPNLKGVITADSDGQHSVKDICKCADLILENQDSLILGCRNFDASHVPKRNRFGNKTTRNVLKLFVGVSVTDTQTGLRGLPKEVMIKFMTTQGDRFEYETNQLIDTIAKKVPIKEFEIETIYLENSNSESHFNPIKDSIAIYKVFIKYIFSSGSSFVIDYLLFALFFYSIFPNISHPYAVSYIIARVLSSIYNYIINAKVVFKNKNSTSIIKYFILAFVQMLVGALIGNWAAKNGHAMIIKLIIDIILFVVNFVIQREFIFVEEKKNEKRK